MSYKIMEENGRYYQLDDNGNPVKEITKAQAETDSSQKETIIDIMTAVEDTKTNVVDIENQIKTNSTLLTTMSQNIQDIENSINDIRVMNFQLLMEKLDNVITAITTQSNTYTPLSVFNNHEEMDSERWQLQADSDANLITEIVKQLQALYDSNNTSLSIDYANAVTIIGTNGVLNLLGGGEYNVTSNGYIVCTYKTIIGAIVNVTKNDEPVFTTTLDILGSKISDFIPVTIGDRISANGLLSLGGGLTVVFYPTKV